MRALRFLSSAAILAAGLGLALGLDAARYDGEALRQMNIALCSTLAACLVAALSIGRCGGERTRTRKIALYVSFALLAAAILTLHAVGLQGILPRRSGSQSVGILALAVNIDLFALVAAAAGLVCRRSFAPPAENPKTHS